MKKGNMWPPSYNLKDAKVHGDIEFGKVLDVGDSHEWSAGWDVALV